MIRNKTTFEILVYHCVAYDPQITATDFYDSFNPETMEMAWTQGKAEPFPTYFSIDKECKAVALTLEQAIAEGYLELQPEEKIVDNTVVHKSKQELVDEGLLELQPEEKIVDGAIVRKSNQELVDEGLLELQPEEKIVDGAIVRKSNQKLVDEGILRPKNPLVMLIKRIKFNSIQLLI